MTKLIMVAALMFGCEMGESQPGPIDEDTSVVEEEVGASFGDCHATVEDCAGVVRESYVSSCGAPYCGSHTCGKSGRTSRMQPREYVQTIEYSPNHFCLQYVSAPPATGLCNCTGE